MKNSLIANVSASIDDLGYRSYWFGGTKIFMNTIYFGQLYQLKNKTKI